MRSFGAQVCRHRVVVRPNFGLMNDKNSYEWIYNTGLLHIYDGKKSFALMGEESGSSQPS